MYKFYIVNMCAFIAGTALQAASMGRSYKRRVTLLLLGFVAINIVVAVLVLLGKADRHIYPFLCTLPFLLPHAFIELKKGLEQLPPKRDKSLIIGGSATDADDLPMGCEYKLLVQLKLCLNGRRSIEIRSKADEKLPFLQWINRVLYDYVLKYPYSLKEITEVREGKIEFYYYRYHILRSMIRPNKTFKENRLKNNCRIYGKQVG